jgi:hypothetical protein
MNPALSMILARQRVADLLRSADRERHMANPEAQPLELVGPYYRLRDGSWLYHRHDSS